MYLLFYTNCDGRIIILTDFSDLHVFPHWYQDNSVPSFQDAFLYSPFNLSLYEHWTTILPCKRLHNVLYHSCHYLHPRCWNTNCWLHWNCFLNKILRIIKEYFIIEYLPQIQMLKSFSYVFTETHLDLCIHWNFQVKVCICWPHYSQRIKNMLHGLSLSKTSSIQF